jgi:hypothetical protein
MNLFSIIVNLLSAGSAVLIPLLGSHILPFHTTRCMNIYLSLLVKRYAGIINNGQENYTYSSLRLP